MSMRKSARGTVLVLRGRVAGVSPKRFGLVRRKNYATPDDPVHLRPSASRVSMISRRVYRVHYPDVRWRGEGRSRIGIDMHESTLSR